MFFTNYESRKGKHIDNQSHVSLNFFWPELERQVRIEGTAKKVEDKISEDYFSSRPENSRLAAWASPQSREIPDREWLEKEFEEVKIKYGQAGYKPPFWGGYEVKPFRIEFWQGRENRLHDRILFQWIENHWEISRLSP